MRKTSENRIPVAWVAAGTMLLTSILPGGAGAAGSSDQWEYDATIYLWGSSIDSTTDNGADIDISFNDILDDLDMAFMGSFGARKGKWSLLADAIYMDISQSEGGSESIPVLDGMLTVTRTVDIDVDLKSWIATFGGGYNVVNNERAVLDIVGGARYLYLDVDIKLDLNHEGELLQTSREIKDSGSDHIWDGIAGIKGKVNLNKNWYMPYYADVGTGGSDLTWQALAGIGYHFKWGEVLLAYRYLDYNFKSDVVLEDMTISGPALGATFRF